MKTPILSLLVAVGLIGGVSASTLTGDLTNGLVSYYGFNGNYLDSSINANHLNQLQDVTLELDRFGNANSAMIFNSSHSFAKSENQINISGNNDRTLSYWIFSKNPLNGVNEILFWGNTNYPPDWGQQSALDLQSYYGGSAVFWGQEADFYAQNLGDFSFNSWHQITFSYNNSIAQSAMYLDGIKLIDNINIVDNSLDTLNGELILGYRHDGVKTGTVIDDVTIYNRALSAFEISQLYAAQSVPEPSTYVLFGIGAVGLLMVMRRKKTA